MPYSGASLVAQMVKNLPVMWETRLNLWVGKIPWRMEWLSTSVSLSRKVHGHRSLVDYGSWGRKELYMTK